MPGSSPPSDNAALIDLVLEATEMMDEKERVRVVRLPAAFGSDEPSDALGIFVRTPAAGYLQIGVIRPWMGRCSVRITAAKELLSLTNPFVFRDYEREDFTSIADAEAEARAFLNSCREVSD